MCGVAGIVKLTGSTTPEDVAAVHRMMEAQIHRGPDGSGLYQDSRAVLGHRRLSIIDLSEAGRQPMSNETCSQCSQSKGTVWVTYNGEIYNFKELHDELVSHGHHFRSKTDTEVLVHGCVEWEIEGLLARLRGMFAFALYAPDPPSSSRLYLVRDRFGIKPLYYVQDQEKVIFASEVRAIMKTGMVPDETNLEALVRFLQLGSVPVPLTTNKNVLALPAAHYLAIDERRIKLTPYWDLSLHHPQSPETFTDFDNCITTTRHHLEEAVKCHLISDVPLGIFLSGGIDSSALVALASRFQNRPLTTLSVVFDEQKYSEAAYADLTAKRYQTNHHQVLLRSRDFFEDLPQIFAAMDQPTVDGVNTYYVAKAAKEAGLTVVLSGTGGDEVFLGYDHYRKAFSMESSWRLFSRLPILVRRGLLGIAMRAKPLVGRIGFEKLEYLEVPSPENAYLVFRGLFSPRRIQDLLGISESEFGRVAAFPCIGPRTRSLSDHTIPQSLVNSFIFLEFAHYLQNVLLKDIDVMSMVHSIETRVPFLDHHLVEHVTPMPARVKLDSAMNKPLLVRALGNDLPREVWDRPKMGFAFPFTDWLNEHAEELQAESLQQKFLDQKAIKSVWKDFKDGGLYWSRPWATVVLARWSGMRSDGL